MSTFSVASLQNVTNKSVENIRSILKIFEYHIPNYMYVESNKN